MSNMDFSDRHEYVGASEMASIMGLNVHDPAFEVWARKTKRTAGDYQSGDIERGKALEPIVIEQLPSREDVFETAPARLIPVLHSFGDRVRAHPDGVIRMEHPTIPTDEWGLLEVKAPRAETFARIKEQGLPLENILQVQTGLEVYGMDWGAFAIKDCQSWETLVFPMLRENLGLVRRGNEWYDEFVVGNTAPPPFPKDPLPPVPRLGGDLVYVSPDDDEWVELMEEYSTMRETKALLKQVWEVATEDKASLKDRIIAKMIALETACAEGCGWKIRVALEQTQNRFNQQVLAELGPFDPYKVQSILEEELQAPPHVQSIMGRLGLTARIDPYDKDVFYRAGDPFRSVNGWKSKVDD